MTDLTNFAIANGMNALVLGTGAREHALAWKLTHSKKVEKVYLHPGNPGTQKLGFETLGPQAVDVESIALEAKKHHIQLVVIGPEMYLASGYAEKLRKYGFDVFGPNSESAMLETSKVFSKEFMQNSGIPTAQFFVVDDFQRMTDATVKFPVVLKLDGLAAGKGVVIAEKKEDVLEFAERVFNKNEFGKGPHRVVFEEFIQGVEVSLIGLCDGKSFYPLSTATDYKRVGDHGTGPNTGGMGVISPSPFESETLLARVQKEVVEKVLQGLKTQELDYRGALYIGLMIKPDGSPYVLEFNARFGDPETQCLMLRLESDLSDYALATAQGKLDSLPPMKFSDQTSLYVVLAAEGYPGKVTTGDIISGWDTLAKNFHIFFSGVSETNGKLYTHGGRVLGVGTLSPNTEKARTSIYSEMKKIEFRGMHFRKDIGTT